MKKINLFILTILSTLVFNCNNNPQINSITVIELEQIIAKDSTIQILDVRTSFEHDSGVILNAKKVSLMSSSFITESINALDITEPVYVYCKSGRRSKVACGVLLDKGYTVYNLEGGFDAWDEKLKN